MRDGEIRFDLPAAQVSKELLAALYAQREHELAGAPPAPADEPAAAVPVAPYCR